MEMIPFEQRSGKVCYFCGNEHVKYRIPIGGMPYQLPVCNRCAAIHPKITFKTDNGFYAALGVTLSPAIGVDYTNELLKIDEFVKAVYADVIETSDATKSGWYNEDDIRLAVGRVILKQFGGEL